jgi:hypothetical protein
VKLDKRIPAFLFLVIYLFSATAIGELVKLPALVGHYTDHRDENSSIALTTFLIQHYYYEDGTDEDAAEDKKLPFKSLDNANSVSFISLSPPYVLNALNKTETEKKNLFGIYTDRFLQSRYLSTIWQPPRHG